MAKLRIEIWPSSHTYADHMAKLWLDPENCTGIWTRDSEWIYSVGGQENDIGIGFLVVLHAIHADMKKIT